MLLVGVTSVYLLKIFKLLLNLYESNFFQAGKYLNNRSHTLSLSITIGFKYYSSTGLRSPCLMKIEEHGQPKILTPVRKSSSCLTTVCPRSRSCPLELTVSPEPESKLSFPELFPLLSASCKVNNCKEILVFSDPLVKTAS